MNYKELHISIDSIVLKGRLRIAKPQTGLIIFSHGSGSSRMSSRNNFVADLLLKEGFSTLLFDLLTESEDHIHENRFNIDLLTQRLVTVTEWIVTQKEMKTTPVGLFGASTGAASALQAVPLLKNKIKALVSRGGRPDLALSILHKIQIPTLLIVGGNDPVVIELNKMAYSKLAGTKKMTLVEGATHLFSEPGKLEAVAKFTADWFKTYLKK